MNIKNSILRRAAAFLPAAVLGLAIGLGFNAWRHRRASDLSPPQVPARQNESAESSSAAPEPEPELEQTIEPPIDDAAEFVRRFTGSRHSSPLRRELDRDTLTASLTPDAFLTMIRDGTLPPGLWESGALRERLRAWAAADRQRFLELAADLPEFADRACVEAVVQALTAAEFRGFMESRAAEPLFGNMWLWQKALAAIAHTDPAGALALLGELPLTEGQKERVTAFTFAELLDGAKDQPAQWSRLFRLVLDTTKGQPPDKQREFFSFALDDLSTEHAATAWPVLRDAGVETSMQREFLRKWAYGDPGAALAEVVAHFPSVTADYETQRLYQELAVQSAVRAQLLGGAKSRDPAAWLTLAENVPSGPGRDAFLAGLTQQAASANPALAAQLLPHVSPEHRAQAINTIVELWTVRDAVAASEWVYSLPPGLERDQAASGFARRLAESDPERAAQWAITIQDESNRRSALQKAYQTWQRLDPAAATRWAQSESRLTAEDHAVLGGERP